MMETVSCKIEDSAILISREVGMSLRLAIEAKLQLDLVVMVDFTGVESVSQSCMDELLGSMIHKHGMQLFSKILFVNCSPAVRSVLSFVANDRLATLNKQSA